METCTDLNKILQTWKWWHSFWTLHCSFTELYIVFVDMSNFK